MMREINRFNLLLKSPSNLFTLTSYLTIYILTGNKGIKFNLSILFDQNLRIYV